MSFTNCYTLGPASDLGEGFIISPSFSFPFSSKPPGDNEKRRFPFWSSHEGCSIRVSAEIDSIQTGGVPRMHEADLAIINDPHATTQKSYEFVARGSSNVTLLLVQSLPGMKRADVAKSKPHFSSHFTVWLGADGPGLLMQAGRRSSSTKLQIFRLEEGESILFFDADKEVTKITAQAVGEHPMWRRATEGEVADYVLGEAKERGEKNAATRAWSYYALKELGCQSQLAAFLKMFPSFKIR